MFDDLPRASGIYAIVNTSDGCRYVGQARDIRARVRGHCRELEACTHQTSRERRLQEAWKRAGPEAFHAVVLELVSDNKGQCNYHVRPDNLSLAEHYYINERSEYNVDKRIVRDEFRDLVEAKAWRSADSSGRDPRTLSNQPLQPTSGAKIETE